MLVAPVGRAHPTAHGFAAGGAVAERDVQLYLYRERPTSADQLLSNTTAGQQFERFLSQQYRCEHYGWAGGCMGGRSAVAAIRLTL